MTEQSPAGEPVDDTDDRDLKGDCDTWTSELRDSLLASRQVALIVAIGAITLALVEGVALLSLSPLRRTMDYVISVDRRTGYIETAGGFSRGVQPATLASTQAAIIRYVQAREGYAATGSLHGYDLAARLSEGRPLADLKREKSEKHIGPPAADSNAMDAIRIESVLLTSPNTARVRFDRAGPAMNSGGGTAAVVTFQYRPNAPATRPGGGAVRFIVTGYQRISESATSGTLSAPIDLSPRAVLGR